MVIHLLGSTERKRRWSVDTDARPGDRDINQRYSHSFPSCSPFCSVWCMTECSIRTFYSGYWCVWVGCYGFPAVWKGIWVVPEAHHLHTGWRTELPSAAKQAVSQRSASAAGTQEERTDKWGSNQPGEDLSIQREEGNLTADRQHRFN